MSRPAPKTPDVTLHSLAALGSLRDTLAARRREQAEREAREARERVAAEQARRLFVDTVGTVTPLRVRARAHNGAPKPEPWPRQREADEREALRQTLSDEVDHDSLLLTDDGLSFRRPGIGPDVAARLRRGHWAIQAEIDLHGLRREEARAALLEFVDKASQQGRRCVRVVHGKGHGSPGRHPVLKSRVHRWLAQCIAVIVFAQASGPQGGAGAIVALLDRRAAVGGGDRSRRRGPAGDAGTPPSPGRPR